MRQDCRWGLGRDDDEMGIGSQCSSFRGSQVKVVVLRDALDLALDRCRLLDRRGLWRAGARQETGKIGGGANPRGDDDVGGYKRQDLRNDPEWELWQRLGSV